MGLINITNTGSDELAVTKVAPIVMDCATIYQYIVSANPNNNITVLLEGDHFEEKYTTSSSEDFFNDTVALNYNGYLKIQFLLLNSGNAGEFDSSKITISNNTEGKYYSNEVERNNDGINCYKPVDIPTKTSQLLNDGEDGVNVFIDSLTIQDFLDDYLPLAGGTMSGTIDMGNNDILNGGYIISRDVDNIGSSTISPGALSLRTKIDASNQDTFYINNATDGNRGFMLSSATGNSGTAFREKLFFPNVESNYNGTVANNTVALFYGRVSGTDGTAPENFVTKAQLDAISVGGGSVTVDDTITDGSTNPVENNAIYDALVDIDSYAATNSINGDKLVNTSVTESKLAVFHANRIQDGSITSVKLQDNSIINSKVSDNAIDPVSLNNSVNGLGSENQLLSLDGSGNFKWVTPSAGTVTHTTGSFTPTLTASTSGGYTVGTTSAVYSKINNQVFIRIRFTSINDSGTPTGILRINGLPFTANEEFLLNARLNNTSSNIGDIQGSIYSGGTQITLIRTSDSTNNQQASSVSFSNGVIVVSGTYLTSA